MRALAFASAFLCTVSCAARGTAAPSVDANANVVVPYKVAGGGEIRFTVKPRYTVGGPVSFDLDISAGDAQILGPLSGVVLQSDLGGEQTIRHLAPEEVPALEVAPGKRGHATVTWDAKRDDGYDVIAATYSLALDFIIGGTNVRLGTTLELRAR
jgi:hypothetical protein